jgi:hypothetical protein
LPPVVSTLFQQRREEEGKEKQNKIGFYNGREIKKCVRLYLSFGVNSGHFFT